MWPTLNRSYFKLLPICLWPNDNQPEMYSILFNRKLHSQEGSRARGMGGCFVPGNNNYGTVKPVLSDHAWAKKKWSFNRGCRGKNVL